jgi:hypothetical protein
MTQCHICDDYGIIRECTGVRYCMCPTGREKKREWLKLPDTERALFEASSPTLPDAGDLFEAARAKTAGGGEA